jgi:hypothetical protein
MARQIGLEAKNLGLGARNLGLERIFRKIKKFLGGGGFLGGCGVFFEEDDHIAGA